MGPHPIVGESILRAFAKHASASRGIGESAVAETLGEAEDAGVDPKDARALTKR
jgi:hypothetical protein